MKKGAGVYSLNRVPMSLNWGSLKRVSGVHPKEWFFIKRSIIKCKLVYT